MRACCVKLGVSIGKKSDLAYLRRPVQVPA